MTTTALQEIDVALPRRKWLSYSTYKAVQEVWLDKAPSHWGSKRLKYAVALVNNKLVAAASDLPYVGMENIESGTGRHLANAESEQAADGLSNCFQAGDVLFGKLRPYLAKALYATFDGLCSSELLVFRPRDFQSRYLTYLLLTKGFVRVVDSSTYGAKMPRASWDFIGNLRVPLPPLDEQRAIAAFLDRETARIDELIAKKQRLIERLKEKRQAVISRGVSKGLDPNAKMKATGIGWLGEVPAHWKVAALRYFASFGTGSTPDRANSSYWNGDIPWVKTGEVNYEPISTTEETITEDGLRNSACWIAPKGTLLIALYGQGDTRGRVAILSIPAAFNQACVAITPKNGLLVDYVHAFFEFAYSHIRDVGNETTQMNMSMDYVRRVPIAVPPVEEQLKIVAFVAEVRESVKNTSLAVLNAIQRLTEYRSALITAAVTGQIDVRHYGKEAT